MIHKQPLYFPRKGLLVLTVIAGDHHRPRRLSGVSQTIIWVSTKLHRCLVFTCKIF